MQYLKQINSIGIIGGRFYSNEINKEEKIYSDFYLLELRNFCFSKVL